jgi:5-methylcytosine-specific restriction endonuclease McrA
MGETEKRRLSRRRYQLSPKGMATKARYRASSLGQQTRLAQQQRIIQKDKMYYIKRKLVSKYGVTYEEFEQMFAKQNHQCAICGSTDPHNSGRTKGWHIDHNHSKEKGSKGFIRGVLCGNCNSGGGKFKDDPVLLRKAADWFSQ